MAAPLDEWIELNAEDLEQAVRTHVEALADLVVDDDVETLVRCIMISIRQWAEEKGIE